MVHVIIQMSGSEEKQRMNHLCGIGIRQLLFSWTYIQHNSVLANYTSLQISHAQAPSPLLMHSCNHQTHVQRYHSTAEHSACNPIHLGLLSSSTALLFPHQRGCVCRNCTRAEAERGFVEDPGTLNHIPMLGWQPEKCGAHLCTDQTCLL